MGAFSIWHWVIVLVIVALVFGTKKLRNLGGDVGSAVKSFKDAVNDEHAAVAHESHPAEPTTAKNHAEHRQ